MSFEPGKIAIAIVTHYPRWYRGKLRSVKHTDKVRGDLALELVTEALKFGCNVVAADWKSSKTFRRQLSSLPKIILIKRRSPKSSPSKRQALRKATHIDGVKVIILTEPEKVSLVKDCLPLIVKPILDDETEIVVPKRNDELFKKTYPAYQYESEAEGNKTYNEELRSHKLIDVNHDDFDMFFGPHAILNERKIVSLFMKRYRFNVAHVSFPKWYFHAEELSSINLFPIVTALKRGFKVKGIEVPFKYPASQKQNEEVGARDLFYEKRKAQRIGLIIELLHFVAFLEKYKGARIKKIKA